MCKRIASKWPNRDLSTKIPPYCTTLSYLAILSVETRTLLSEGVRHDTEGKVSRYARSIQAGCKGRCRPHCLFCLTGGETADKGIFRMARNRECRMGALSRNLRHSVRRDDAGSVRHPTGSLGTRA